jgi:hypothetical protein
MLGFLLPLFIFLSLQTVALILSLVGDRPIKLAKGCWVFLRQPNLQAMRSHWNLLKEFPFPWHLRLEANRLFLVE